MCYNKTITYYVNSLAVVTLIFAFYQFFLYIKKREPLHTYKYFYGTPFQPLLKLLVHINFKALQLFANKHVRKHFTIPRAVYNTYSRIIEVSIQYILSVPF